MTNIAIIHTLPLEFYPPVTNFIDFLSKQDDIELSVFSTGNDKNRQIYKNDSIKIYRFNNLGKSILSKGISSVLNSFKILFILLRKKPNILIYYETFSAGRVILPCIFFRKKKLIVINHEYFSNEWYQTTASKSIRFYHKIEQNYLFKKANKISQTNADRRKLFLEDNVGLDGNKMILLPNYPSKNWRGKQIELNSVDILKTVYVGTLSLDYSYVREYCNWVINKKGKVLFDIYSYNLDDKTKSYVKGLNSPYIRIFDKGIEYRKIPVQLEGYHVGLVLYKAITKNFQYNAPNKIFEYLALDLDVWCSDKLITARDYERLDCYPKMIMVDYEKLEEFDVDKAINKEELDYVQSPYVCEPVYKKFLKQILN
ncbi:hypothetical protein AB2B38_008925 [Balneola sp. MJW-20]|uniref:hypothetical protein n=1 Tax=Gracilimonas aurantiaca TaxID=3234185 RepID=UPI0034660F97